MSRTLYKDARPSADQRSQAAGGNSPGLPVRASRSAQLASLLGKELLLDPHEARPLASVRSGAVDHEGMAEDHVPWLARQFDHAKGHAVDNGFPVHESAGPVGR